MVRQNFFATRRGFHVGDFVLPLIFLLLLVLNKIPFVHLFLGGAELGVYFVALFVWGRYTLNFFAPLFVFAFGLLHDVLSGAPLGLWASAFCIFFGVTINYAWILTVHNFYFSLMVFAIIVSLIYGFIFLIGTLHSDFDFNFMTAIFNIGFACFSYILVAPVLGLLIRWIYRGDRSSAPA